VTALAYLCVNVETKWNTPVLLEDQKVASKDTAARLEEILRDIKPSLARERPVRGTGQCHAAYARGKAFALIPAHIAYRSELNEAEPENIARAQDWALARKRQLPSEKFIRELHRRMLGDLWKWARKFRTSERHLGIPFYEIPVALRHLLDDAKAWIEYQTYAHDEVAIRFHHALVQIHAFPNGHGRHARLMADLLAMTFGRKGFSWGRESLREPGILRRRYIEALQVADIHEIGPLLAFARS
jgi:Fic-DOC domain mobile mystery protein B